MKSNKNSLSNKQVPLHVKVKMYNVGFGDCFLLTFVYDKDVNKNILIDCGTSTENKTKMLKIVNAVAKDCNGKLDAVIVTHRHKDHLSAFNDKDTGKILESLNPDLVIQPWTEHPDADKAALEAPSVYTKGFVQHLQSLENAQKFTQTLFSNPNKLLFAAGTRTLNQIVFEASLSIPNKAAVQRLASMGKKRAYVYAGCKSGLESILPGVDISVLGPPTLKQSEAIKSQTAWDENEFWKLFSRLANVSFDNTTVSKGKSVLFPKAETSAISKTPAFNKWLFKKLDIIQVQNVRQIVRILDNAINNTSVILLFKVGDKGLLFSGDAQLENWSFTLDNPDSKKILKDVCLYKVGHHGSTNATPKSMWKIISNKGTKKNSFYSLLSTKSGKHSGVPQKKLCEALNNSSKLVSTQDLRSKLSTEIIIM